jgi:DNA-binding LacI/PurR family transcriptional regulator
MGITIKDVAKEANVSPSTVSRVVAGSSRISEETKVRVNAVIKRLNYHPNVIARSLVNKSTRVVGIILPSAAEDLFRNPFFIQIMAGISAYVQEYGYYVMCTFCKTAEEEAAAVRNYVTSNLVDGVILTVVRQSDRCIEYLQEMDFPFVVIGRPEETKNILWVDNDNVQAMYNVVNKLVLDGYREIAFIGANSELNVSKDRLSGYKQAHSVHNMAVDEKRIVEVGQFKEDLGYKAMENILGRSKVQAVVATDDLLAFGANVYLTQSNRRDIAIVGFNNTLLAQYQNPPLTSVDINAEKIGYYTAKLLVDKLENKVEKTFFIIETNLIERESTTKIPKNNEIA